MALEPRARGLRQLPAKRRSTQVRGMLLPFSGDRRRAILVADLSLSSALCSTPCPVGQHDGVIRNRDPDARLDDLTALMDANTPADPPFTAGDHPDLPDVFPNRNAYTSLRPMNRDRYSATFAERVNGPESGAGVLSAFDSTNRVSSQAAAGSASSGRSRPSNERRRSFSAL